MVLATTFARQILAHIDMLDGPLGPLMVDVRPLGRTRRIVSTLKLMCWCYEVMLNDNTARYLTLHGGGGCVDMEV